MTADKKVIRVLVIEDVPDDAELVLLELRNGGFEPHAQRVCTASQLSRALLEPWDIVLSDHSMPELSAPLALKQVREIDADLPFIIVSGSVGEALAVEAMKAGAQDFFLKDQLGRLASAVERELREAAGRRERARAEERLRAIFEQPIAGIAQTDSLGRFVMVNERFCQLVARPREQLLAMNMLELTHPLDRDRFSERFERIVNEGSGVTADKRYLRGDGGFVWVRSAMSLARDSAQRPLVMVELVQDITEEKRALDAVAESEARFHNIADSAPVMLWVADASGQRTYLNAQWYDFTGLEPGKGLGFGWREAVHPDDASLAEAHLPLQRSEPWPRRLEYRLRHRDGDYRWVLSTVLPRLGASGELLGQVASIIDISERKRAELEREQVVDELSRTVRFSEMFIGILSHDLRNPLSAITTAAGMLLRRAEANDRLNVPVTRILSSADRMRRMIDQLLDFTRMRTRQGLTLERQPVDLAELCHRAVDEVLIARDGLDIRLEVHGSGEGQWDRDRLAQLVSNLVANAAQHRQPNTPVIVHLDGTREGAVTLEVRNQGRIPSAVLPLIFEPFRAARTGLAERARGSSGLGLGLYISQQIVQAHQGSIRVESGHDEVTRFIVELPRTVTSSAGPRQAFTSSTGDD